MHQWANGCMDFGLVRCMVLVAFLNCNDVASQWREKGTRWTATPQSDF